jgi:hypothetical protein
MTDEIELFAAYVMHPDTNRSAFEAMLADCMADTETIAVMKVLNVVLRSNPCPEITGSQSQSLSSAVS